MRHTLSILFLACLTCGLATGYYHIVGSLTPVEFGAWFMVASGIMVASGEVI